MNQVDWEVREWLPVGPYSEAMPRALWWSYGGRLFLVSEVPLYMAIQWTLKREA